MTEFSTHGWLRHPDPSKVGVDAEKLKMLADAYEKEAAAHNPAISGLIEENRKYFSIWQEHIDKAIPERKWLQEQYVKMRDGKIPLPDLGVVPSAEENYGAFLKYVAAIQVMHSKAANKLEEAALAFEKDFFGTEKGKKFQAYLTASKKNDFTDFMKDPQYGAAVETRWASEHKNDKGKAVGQKPLPSR